jgi:glycosyltransferase involved in cell wall biosynthesis
VIMKGKLKISILVWNLSTNDGYIRASLLEKALNKLGHEVELMGFLFGKELYGAIPSDAKLFTLQGGKYPDFLKTIGKFIEHIDGDIIYAIKPQPASYGVGLLKKIISNKPIILDIDDWEMSWHGGDAWEYRPTPKQLARDILKSNGALREPSHPLYLKWMENYTLKANAITVHTSFLQKRFGGISVPNGKDTDLFNPENYNSQASKQRYGFAFYKTLMFPGAPRPYKGLEDILMALDKLNKPEFKVVIVGGSPYDDYDEQLQEKWGRWIIKLPKQPANLMPEIVAGADVVVIPQRDTLETRAQFPLKLTDGMAMAKPVLSTNVGDIPEILGDTGYLVDANSPEQIAEKIQYIFANYTEALEKGQKARERCVQMYSINSMASSLESVISQL